MTRPETQSPLPVWPRASPLAAVNDIVFGGRPNEYKVWLDIYDGLYPRGSLTMSDGMSSTPRWKRLAGVKIERLETFRQALRRRRRQSEQRL